MHIGERVSWRIIVFDLVWKNFNPIRWARQNINPIYCVLNLLSPYMLMQAACLGFVRSCSPWSIHFLSMGSTTVKNTVCRSLPWYFTSRYSIPEVMMECMLKQLPTWWMISNSKKLFGINTLSSKDGWIQRIFSRMTLDSSNVKQFLTQYNSYRTGISSFVLLLFEDGLSTFQVTYEPNLGKLVWNPSSTLRIQLLRLLLEERSMPESMRSFFFETEISLSIFGLMLLRRLNTDPFPFMNRNLFRTEYDGERFWREASVLLSPLVCLFPFENISQVPDSCMTCYSVLAELFSSSPRGRVFSVKSLTIFVKSVRNSDPRSRSIYR